MFSQKHLSQISNKWLLICTDCEKQKESDFWFAQKFYYVFSITENTKDFSQYLAI